MYHQPIDVDSDEWLGCGVDNHEPECLCDVHIPDVGNARDVCVRDAVMDIHMGLEICELRGYVMPWDDSQIISYIEDILRVRDNWSEDALVAHRPLVASDRVGANGSTVMGDWADMRNNVRNMLACGVYDSIVDVLDALGMSAQEFTRVATSHKFSFNREWLLQFERAVTLAECSSVAELARRFNLSAKTAGNLWSYWSTPFKVVESHKPSVVMVRHMLRDGHDVDEIIATVYATLGVEVTRASVFKTRSRMKDN